MNLNSYPSSYHNNIYFTAQNKSNLLYSGNETLYFNKCYNEEKADHLKQCDKTTKDIIGKFYDIPEYSFYDLPSLSNKKNR